MSEPNPIFTHPSHRLVIYNFRYHSHIPCRYTANVFQSLWKQKTGFNWACQLITQIWRLIYGKWLHCSKLNHVGEELDDHNKEFIIDTKIANKRERDLGALINLYKPDFSTTLFTILYNSITARKNWYRLINTAIETTGTEKYTILSSSKLIHTWLGIQSTPSLYLST